MRSSTACSKHTSSFRTCLSQMGCILERECHSPFRRTSHYHISIDTNDTRIRPLNVLLVDPLPVSHSQKQNKKKIHYGCRLAIDFRTLYKCNNFRNKMDESVNLESLHCGKMGHYKRDCCQWECQGEDSKCHQGGF